MIESRSKRPKRLWIAAIMNVILGLLSISFLVFLATTARVPEELRITGGMTAFAAATAGFMVISSVMALLGKPSWRQLMLSAALIYYGSILAQNFNFLVSGSETLVPAQKLASNAVRSGLEIAINLWALLSTKTRDYFRSIPSAP
ncbi:MAG: hypothetical protein EON58_11990 [Alphaproteobacteria bacterium]|nr:MAG: hypothetical protein EON58_11990 [Alphaproteobacteria bacterium]